jgi:hypothetical protein
MDGSPEDFVCQVGFLADRDCCLCPRLLLALLAHYLLNSGVIFDRFDKLGMVEYSLIAVKHEKSVWAFWHFWFFAHLS